mgnify:FL=1
MFRQEGREVAMDNLSTCMICEEEFEESQSVVVVYDATYEGQLDENGNLIDKEDDDYTEDTESEHYRRPVIGSFELDESFMGATTERAVYCTECWDFMVVYSWKLAKQRPEGWREKEDR